MKLNMQHTRKHAREEPRSNVAKDIAPKFAARNDVNNMDWVNTDKVVTKSTVSKDVGDLRATLLSISRADPKRAASAINSSLSAKSNNEVKEGVIEYLLQKSATDVTHQLIVDGIRSSIAHHNTRGSRTLAAEGFQNCYKRLQKTPDDTG